MKQIITLILTTLLPTALLPAAEAEKPSIELGAPFSDSAIDRFSPGNRSLTLDELLAHLFS